jgi:predicted MFS family arabinose efflux permease
MFGARLIRRVGMRTWLVASTASVALGFLALSHLPTSGHYSALFAVVVLIGFGTVGTVFGTTVMASSGMAQTDQGMVGGVVNTTRQVGAALGVAALVAIAEGAKARVGVATVTGDRNALVAAALVALAAALFAWFGVDPQPPAHLAPATPAFRHDVRTTANTRRTP